MPQLDLGNTGCLTVKTVIMRIHMNPLPSCCYNASITIGTRKRQCNKLTCTAINNGGLWTRESLAITFAGLATASAKRRELAGNVLHVVGRLGEVSHTHPLGCKAALLQTILSGK